MHLDWVGYMLLSRERYRLKITKQTTAKRFSLALSSKKTERSSGAESKLSFASCYPLFHQHLSARPLAADGIGTRGGGKQEFFAACLLPISCTSPDTSSLLTSRPSSPLSPPFLLRFTLQSPIPLRLLFFHPTHPLRPTSDPSIKGAISLSSYIPFSPLFPSSPLPTPFSITLFCLPLFS